MHQPSSPKTGIVPNAPDTDRQAENLRTADPREIDPRSIDSLLAVVARLRDPEKGCPWDLKQSFQSIMPFTLEEAYEVAEAIENNDMSELCEELGDLLFQVAIYSRMAEEQGDFDFGDVVASISTKMIRRHPHVFGNAAFANEAEMRENWEAMKAAEREAKGKRLVGGVLDGVALALPALVRSEKLQKRAARVGFDWDDPAGVAEKVREELAECEETFEHPAGARTRLHEVGDLLFSCVNLARHLGVDAEQALREANDRFERRFQRVEVCLHAAGKEPAPEHRDDMERLWRSAKGEVG